MPRSLIAHALIVLLAMPLLSRAAYASDFTILIERERPQGQLVPGHITVNGELIGQTYENADKLILPTVYRGTLRYVSSKGFVQGPIGHLANTGDFLLEVSGVNGRTDILLHGGNKPYQSQGCILLGAVGRDPATLERTLGADHPLRKLRRLFYGSDNPNATPDKTIIITITVAKEAMAILPLHLLRTVAALDVSQNSILTESAPTDASEQARIDSLQKHFSEVRTAVAGALLSNVPDRPIPALVDPSPIEQMNALVANGIDDPTPKALDQLATHILSSSAPQVLRDGLDVAKLRAFAEIAPPSSFPTDAEAQSYIDSVGSYFKTDLISRQRLKAIDKAEILRMVNVHLNDLVNSTDANSTFQSLANAANTVSSADLDTGIKSLAALDQSIHDMVNAKLEQADKLKALGSNLSSQITTVLERSKSVSSDMTEMVFSRKEDIGVNVEGLASKVAQNAISSQTLALVARGALPTKDLAKLLENPLVAADNALVNVRTAVKTMADLQNISATSIKDMLTRNDKIVTDLAEQVGVDPQVVTTAKQIVQIGTAIAGGNYLAAAQAIPGVGSVFSGIGLGGGGGDSAVMSQLAVMDGKLNRLLDGQREIKNQLKDLSMKVDRLTAIVERNHEEVMQQLTRIEQDVIVNNAIGIENFKKEFYSCYSMFDFQPPNVLYQTGIASVSDYQTKQMTFAAHQVDFDRCQSALKSFLSPMNISPLFTYRTNMLTLGKSSSQVEPSDYLDKFVAPHFDYFKHKFGDETAQAIVGAALLSTSFTAKDIADKYESMQKARNKGTRIETELRTTALTEPNLFINASALSEVADYAPTILNLWSFVDFDTKLLLTPDNLLNVQSTFSEKRLTVVKELTEPPLKTLLGLLSTALAQQALLSGDLLLPELEKDVARKVNSADVEAVLKVNPLLRHNLTVFIIADHLRLSGTKSMLYSTRLNGTNEKDLQSVLKAVPGLKALELRHYGMTNSEWPNVDGSKCGDKTIASDDAKWHIELTPTICEPLPEPSQVDWENHADRLSHTSGWTDVYVRRERVIQSLAAYEFPATLKSQDDQSALWTLASKSSPAPGR